MPIVLLTVLLSNLAQGASIVAKNLRTEYLQNPLGLDKSQPRFTWELESLSGARAIQQASYRILVGSNGVADGSTWDSAVVASNKSFQVKYAGPSLASGKVYHWAVTVVATFSGGMHTKWQPKTEEMASEETISSPATFSVGILNYEDWGGDFIGMGENTTGQHDKLACPWFRKRFLLPASATMTGLMYVASAGYHELSINGQPASEGVLLPSISYLPKRVLYRTYNVTSLLKPGEDNVIGIWAYAG
jgi:alpha-L-rhamnosidase